MAISDFFNRRAMVYRMDRSGRSPAGGVMPSELILLDNVPCAVSEAKITERGMHGTTGLEITHWVWMAARHYGMFNETARIRTTYRGLAQEFEIQSLEDPMSMGQHLKVGCLETRGAGADR